MTVAELIAHLQTQPQELQVAYHLFSECALMEAKEISVQEMCVARPDGWIHEKRPDKPSQTYLVFPGN